MKKAEVIDLFIEIKQEYPFFDDSDANIERHLGYLKDFPFDVALSNVRAHIASDSKRAPGIADIRGRLGDQLEAQKSKDAALDHFANLDAWIAGSAPPPEGYWERGRKAIRGEAND